MTENRNNVQKINPKVQKFLKQNQSEPEESKNLLKSQPNVTNSKKSLTRTSNHELVEILENYNASKPQINNASSQNSLFVANTNQVTGLLKEILTNDANGGHRLSAVCEANGDFHKGTSGIYLVQNKPIESKQQRKKCARQTKAAPKSQQRSLSKPKLETGDNLDVTELTNTHSNSAHFNLKKFKSHKLEEMELECLSLEKKIRLLRKDLAEMEHCLSLMQTIKQSFSNEFRRRKSSDNAKKKLTVPANHPQSPPTSITQPQPPRPVGKYPGTTDSELAKHQSLDGVHQRKKPHRHRSMESLSIKVNSDQRSLTKNKEKLRATATTASNSNASQTSECTWVSSSFMNDVSYNIVSDSSEEAGTRLVTDGDEDAKSAQSSTSEQLISHSIDKCANSSQLHRQSGNGVGFIRKLWQNVKSNMKTRPRKCCGARNITKLNGIERTEKVAGKHGGLHKTLADRSSTSHYFTATENATNNNGHKQH